MSTLTAYYDLGIGPVSFDCVPFLVRARMAAEDAGCDAVHVVIVPDPNGVERMFRDKRHLYDAAEMHWRLWNLVVPACQLAGASVTIATSWEQARKLATRDVYPHDWDRQSLASKPYLMRPIIDAARQGRVIPRLRASEHARRHVQAYFASFGKPVVTFTIRQTYEPARNTGDAWRPLAESMRESFALVAIDDTAVELARGYGYGGLSLDLRMACYECAAMNIIGNHGPHVLLWFSRCSFWQFGAAMPFRDWQTFWEQHIGLDVSAEEQLPWAAENQRVIYRPMAVEHIPH